MRRTPLTTTLLLICVLAANTSAQKQIQMYATIVDSEGKPASSVSPEDVRVAANGVDAKVLKVEAVEWTTKVQILIDNGPGLGPGGLVPLRNGLRALLEALPPGLEATLVTTAPQPRFLVRATTDRQALLAGVERLAPDSSTGRFVESLGEALQRFERDKGDFFGVIVTLGTTQGDNQVQDRDVKEVYERARKKPTTVHVVMMSTGALTASGGGVQTEVGTDIAKQTGGRYESINASSRLATLLPEIGALIKGGEGTGRQFRVTAERAASDPVSKLSMSGRNGKAVTNITLISN
jgi:hypothetical protein